MGLRKALEPSLNEAQGWEAIEKKINIKIVNMFK
jgi:hypothetical protein